MTPDTHNIASFVLGKAHFTDLAVAKSKKCNAAYGEAGIARRVGFADAIFHKILPSS